MIWLLAGLVVVLLLGSVLGGYPAAETAQAGLWFLLALVFVLAVASQIIELGRPTDRAPSRAAAFCEDATITP